jgi:murein DD-endopeptidase MepM/ murein hydrolase activator NlpD
LATRIGVAIVVLLALAVAAAFGTGRLEGDGPRIGAPESLIVGAGGAELRIELEDPGSGLRSFSIRLLHQNGSRSVLDEQYPGGFLISDVDAVDGLVVSLELDPALLRVPDGSATLVLSARDWAWRDGFNGNRTQLSVPLVVDTRPPRIDLVSGLTYVYRGGSAAAVYRVDDENAAHGVKVGDARFTGFPHPMAEQSERAEPGLRVALFSIPIEAAKRPKVEVFAVDQGGNEASVSFPAHVLERAFATSDITISERFIRDVAQPLAESNGIDTSHAVTAFRQVNEELRARNEATIREQIQSSSAAPLWQTSFRQLASSKVMSRFAELRNYLLDGERISQARHLGFDLASTARAPVGAAARGSVVFAGDLGIYGSCVLVDHGLGLTTLYAHLSQIDVAVGDEIAQDQPIGRTGATGLAGGDHLHFAIMLSGHYVDPLEWWDPKWVRSHVRVRLERSKS